MHCCTKLHLVQSVKYFLFTGSFITMVPFTTSMYKNRIREILNKKSSAGTIEGTILTKSAVTTGGGGYMYLPYD